MLQFSGTLRNATVWITPLSSWRISAQQLLAASSRAANPRPILAQAKEEDRPSSKPKINGKGLIMSENPMIQAAFDNLKGSKQALLAREEDTVIATKIEAATSVESLLDIANDRHIKRENAFAIVTLLLDWVNNGKVKLKVFEMDKRFLKLCTLLSQPETQKIFEQKEGKSKKFMEELNLFYNINEINEATKEVANLPVQHMIKVMSGLASQKRRSTPLLRALSFNISRSSEPLNIKQLSDILYSMAILNYADEVLLQKICGDLIGPTHSVPKSSVIGSILRSLGSLRYKNEELMDKLSEWVVDHSKDMRSQDLCSMFLTLAVLGYTPSNAEVLNKVVVEHLKETEMTKPAEWLDIVWALTILQMAQNRHIASVLDSNFIKKLTESVEIPVPKKHKLLNINGAAQLLMKDYKGPLLESDSNVLNAAIRRSKEKDVYTKIVIGTLENIFPSPKYCTTNIDTGMGFLLDAEVCINSEGKKLPVDSEIDEKNGIRIAVMTHNYHDFSRGKQELLGFNNFYCRILEAKGYKILSIPHPEFSMEDKISQRIIYINDRIKSIAK